MALPAIVVPILEAAGAGAVLGFANEGVKKGMGFVKEKFTGEKAAKENEKENRRLTKEFEEAKKKKLAAQKKAAAKKKSDEKKAEAARKREERKAESDAKREAARKRVREKKEDANARQFNAAEERATRDAEREEKRAVREAEKERVKAITEENKERADNLKRLEKEWAEADKLIQGPQQIVIPGKPQPDPFRPPAQPAQPEEKKAHPVTEAQKKRAKREAARSYEAQTRRLLLGQIGSGGRGTLDWLAEHGPGAVEARQSAKDAAERARSAELKRRDEERKKNQPLTTKKPKADPYSTDPKIYAFDEEGNKYEVDSRIRPLLTDPYAQGFLIE